jgi:D-arabinose 1-dehydrogenase-like Zn-dependent alcohol dehydrogenase
MRVAQARTAGSPFEIVERAIPEPGHGQIRIKVEACGICHSDMLTRNGMWPGIELPRVPGHELVGVVDAVGPGVAMWKQGQRVGVGWHGGHCFDCLPCRDGDFISCNNHKVTGISHDGGYAEYAIARQEAVAAVPDGLDPADAGPLLCAGVTTYNSLRNSGARPGDLVAVQGIGGLGHLGVQFARQMGFHTVAISRGAGKQELALELGAHRYLDAATDDVNAELQAMGGAKVILATAPNSKAISSVFDGLGRNGLLLVVGATMDPIEVSPFQLIPGRRALRGWPSGTARDSEDTLKFCALTGIRPRIETFPLEQANQAYERMHSNQVRFRAVLTM